MTGLLFGLLPAWSATRGDIAEALRENPRTTPTGVSRSPLRSFLVTADLALELVLLAGAGLLIKGFLRLRAVDPGFNPANVITMYLQLPGTRYPQIPIHSCGTAWGIYCSTKKRFRETSELRIWPVVCLTRDLPRHSLL
jgi:hypothetical protein